MREKAELVTQLMADALAASVTDVGQPGMYCRVLQRLRVFGRCWSDSVCERRKCLSADSGVLHKVAVAIEEWGRR